MFENEKFSLRHHNLLLISFEIVFYISSKIFNIIETYINNVMDDENIPSAISQSVFKIKHIK